MRILLCLVLFATPLSAQQKHASFQLKNGLTVVLRPITGCTDVAMVTLFDLGEYHDPKGKSGLAHLVEHCYVTSAAGKTPLRTYTQLIKRYPKGHNAQTGSHFTVIAFVFEAKKLEDELTEAAARMSQLRITREDLLREKPRMKSEVANMFGRLPHLAVTNLAREQILPSPRGGRKGGQTDHIEKISLKEAQQHWKSYYRPNNAILILAGAVDQKGTRALVEKHFGRIEKGQAVPKPGEVETAKSAKLREIEVQSISPSFGSRVALAWKAPRPGDKDYAAYLILANRLAYTAFPLRTSSNPIPIAVRTLDDPDLISMQVEAKKDEKPEDALARLDKLVVKALEKKLSASDLRNVETFFGSFLGLRDQPDLFLSRVPYFVAFSLGRRIQMGVDGEKIKKSLKAVTDKDLKRVAEKWFGKQRAAIFVRVKK